MVPPDGTVPASTPSPASLDPLLGVKLADRYEIVCKIGEGGMGAVYEARHTVIGKRVAVKVLLEKFLEKTDLVARLLQEARVASSIGHENIVDVTDFGTTSDGRAFVVMEFLEGEALAQLVMRDAPLPIERSLRIGRQVASALGAAHAKGIVHRDVKPENVYLCRRGDADFVKVVDFGISKAVRTRDEGPEWQRLTTTGMVLGTPLYMSPEQARGVEDIDHRADIWAVGVLLYECLTGEVPFRAKNYLGVISQVLTHDATPPSQLRPELGIPSAVEAVVMRALAKDRERRYQTMAHVERDLERLLAGDSNVGLPPEGADAPPSAIAVGNRWHLGAAAALAIAVGIAVALVRTDGAARRPTMTTPSQLPAATVPRAKAPPVAVPSKVEPAERRLPAREGTAHRKPAQGGRKSPRGASADEAPASRPPVAPRPGPSGKADDLIPSPDDVYPTKAPSQR